METMTMGRTKHRKGLQTITSNDKKSWQWTKKQRSSPIQIQEMAVLDYA